jgi:hypothetical protein
VDVEVGVDGGDEIGDRADHPELAVFARPCAAANNALARLIIYETLH